MPSIPKDAPLDSLLIDYTVPPQDLSVDLAKMPALPRSGLIVQVRSVGAVAQ